MDLCRASGVRFRAITLDNPTLSRQSVARAATLLPALRHPHQVLPDRRDDLQRAPGPPRRGDRPGALPLPAART